MEVVAVKTAPTHVRISEYKFDEASGKLALKVHALALQPSHIAYCLDPPKLLAGNLSPTPVGRLSIWNF